MMVTSYSIVITDLDGYDHTITTDVHGINIDFVLSSGADTFSFVITNENDEYSYIEKGCQIEISTGLDASNNIKLVGIIEDAERTLDSSLVMSQINVSGEDWTGRLNHIFFTDKFHDTEISTIVKAILDSTDYSTEKSYRELAGLSSDYTNIDLTAFSFDVASFVWKSLGAAIKELADSVGFEWYVDSDKKLHFYDPSAFAVSIIITDDDLHDKPVIGDFENIVNRAVVIGGYQQSTDISGVTQTTTYIVKDAGATMEESFVPTEDYLSSVFVYTSLVTDSSSEITLSIQTDVASAPSDENLPHGFVTIPIDQITDDGYTEFKFKDHVTLTSGDTYWIVIKGTDSDGVYVGVDGSDDLDFNTRFPYRIAVMSNDMNSQTDYDMIYMNVHRDESIEDEEQAELIAEQILNGYPKKHASIMMHGTDVGIGDLVQLTLTKTGITIDKTMRVMSCTQSLGHLYIYNSMELVEQ